VEAGYQWESWIYGSVGGGIEIAFIDEIGKGFYEFARTPPGSPNHILWEGLSPSTVVGRITSREPSVYSHDYAGEPIDLFVNTAGFRALRGLTNFEVYLSVPVSQILGNSRRDAVVDREVVFYDRNWNPVSRSSEQISRDIPEGDAHRTGLLIDQIGSDLRPGQYFMAVQIQQPETQAIQIYKTPITVEAYRQPDDHLDISDVEIADSITLQSEVSGSGLFQKDKLTVVPLPTRDISPNRPVSLYFEIYNLTRDTFGKTRYQVDYEMETASERFTIVNALGRLIGQGADGPSGRVSYEHDGDTRDEQMHIELSVREIEGSTVRVTVQVTDLLSESDIPAQTSAARSIDLNLIR
jgi:hypothetical protein